MRERDEVTPYQSCANPSCDLDWNDHTPEQAEWCLAYSMYEAYTDLRDEAETRADLTAGDPTARSSLERWEREAERLERFLWPAAQGHDETRDQTPQRPRMRSGSRVAPADLQAAGHRPAAGNSNGPPVRGAGR